MITIERLTEAANNALSKYFTKTVNGVKIGPKIYDHTEEIFMDEEPGASVWCEIPSGMISFFDGTVCTIISADADTVCANVFFGDDCSDAERVEALSYGIDLGSWEIDDIDDFLMLTTDFPASADLEKEISSRFSELLSKSFAEKIGYLLAYFN